MFELLRTGMLTPARFEHPPQQPEAVYLNPEGRALVVERYHALLQSAAPLPSGERTTLRRVVQLQAYALARVVRGEQERYAGYTP